MKKYLFVLLISLMQTLSYGNDECVNAIELIPNSNCNNYTASFSGVTRSGAAPSCAPNSSQDVWFKFTATEQIMNVLVTRASNNNSIYFALEIYENSCAGTVFKCVAPNNGSVNYFNSDFTIGRTYFVRVLNASNQPVSFNYNICIQAFPRPANDECSAAVELIPGVNECNFTNGTFSGALLETAKPSCAANTSQDIWYKFTATEQTMQIYAERAVAGDVLYMGLEIYEDNCNGNRFKCIEVESSVSIRYFGSDFVPGRVYNVRIFNPGNILSTKAFRICLTSYPRPANDECSAAVELIPGVNECNFTNGTFSGALLETAKPSCAANASQDIWYKFTATEQTMQIYAERAVAGDVLYMGLEIYEDNCNGNRFKCIEVESSVSIRYFGNNFVPGRVYNVRIFNPGNILSTKAFRICLTSYPRPANDECSAAIELIPGVNECNFVNGTFSGALLETAKPSCATNASQDIWYKFTATEQTMQIYAERAVAGDVLYMGLEIYEDNCNGNRFKCIEVESSVSIRYFGNNFVPGRVYNVRIFNPGNILSTKAFRICLTSYPRPTNDECSAATELIPGVNECNFTNGSFSGALLEAVRPTCESTTMQDVWYKFTATDPTMLVYIERLDTGDTIYMGLEIYEDSCSGNLFKCVPSNVYSVRYFGNDFVPGRVYYVRVFNPGNTINIKRFKICVSTYPRPVNDLCQNATVLIPSNTCTPVNGTFNGAIKDGVNLNCSSTASQDIWYKFTATAANMTIQLNAVSGLNHAFEVVSGSCTGSQVACINNGGTGVAESAVVGSLTVGNVYYIRVFNTLSALSISNFTICLVGPPPVSCTPSVTITSIATSICEGSSVTFTAAAVNGGAFPHYQWKVNGNNVGGNTATYTSAALTNGSIVSCVMTSNEQCAFPASVTSNNITVLVSAPTVPAFTQIAPVCSGDTFVLPTTSNNGITGTWNPAVNNTATTTYIFTPNSAACTSTATMRVEVKTLNAGATVQGNTATATTIGAAYQWVNCLDNQPINGATGVSFTPAANGSYAVIVTQNGCSKISECVTISTLGVDPFFKNEWAVYPNPTRDNLYIDLPDATEIMIVDMTGKIIQKEFLKSGLNIINVSGLNSGMYIIKSALGGNVKFVKI